jgi:chemotaxis protein MotB
VTLLLALFVLLYASARLDSAEARDVLAGIQSAFPIPLAPAVREPIDAEERPNDAPLREDPSLQQYLAAVLDAHEDPATASTRGTRLREEEQGIVIELAAAEYFPAGGAEIAADKKSVLADLAPILVSSGRSIRFEGHTDDQPIQSDVFPSNWELSAARAGALARYFIEEESLDPTWVATTGYAEYRPLVPNLGPAARARNRRVEIILAHPERRTSGLARDVDAELESLGRMLEALPPVPEQIDSGLREEGASTERSSPLP